MTVLEPKSRPWWRRPTLWLALVLSVPFLIAAVQILNRAQYPFFSWGDQALIDFAVRRATNFEQLNGAYSRFGFDHPGPFYFYVLAAFYWVADTPMRLYFGALMLNVLVIAPVFVLVSRRLNTASATWFTLVLATFVLALGPFFIRDPWNPAIMVLPLFAAFVLVALPSSLLTTCLAIVMASLALQAHIGSIAVIAPLVILIVALRVAATKASGHWLEGRTGRAEATGWRQLLPERRSIVIAGFVTLACWAIPIAEQLIRWREGNFGKIVYYFVFLSDGSQRSAEVAADLVFGASWLPLIPTLRVPPEPPVPALILMVVTVGLCAGGARVAWHRQQRFAFASFVFVAVGMPFAALSIMRIDRLVEVYLLWWIALYPVALLLALGMLWLEGRTVQPTWATKVLALLLVVVTAGSVYSSLNANPRNEKSRVEVAQLWEIVRRNSDPSTPIYLDIADDRAVPYVAGLAIKLNEEGYRYQVPEVFEDGFGQSGNPVEPRQNIRFAIAGEANDVGSGRYVGSTQGRAAITVRVSDR